MDLSTKQNYLFGDVEVDTLGGCLKCGAEERHLRPKAFEVLVCLLERNGRLVTKEEIIGTVWKDTAVSDDALVQCIKEIRRAIGDNPQAPRFIKTIPKIGYRFIGPVRGVCGDSAAGRGGDGGGDPFPGFIQPEEMTRFEVTYEEDSEQNASFRESEVRADAAPAAGPPFAAPGSEGLPSPAPGAVSRRRNLLIAAAIFALIPLSAVAFYLTRRAEVWPAETVLPQTPGKKSVAVMFFENQSGSADVDWLREGLADMLITNLSRSTGLNVLNREQLHVLLERGGQQPQQQDGGRGRQTDTISLQTALDVARKSRADNFIVGSFARLGEKIRLDVRLYEARDGRLLASESFVAEKPELILLEIDLLSLKLERHLGVGGAGGGQPGRPAQIAEVRTENLEAYRNYSLAVEKAQAFHNQRAIELLEKAVALDPEFAMAHARLGYIYAVTWGLADQAKPHLEKAFRLSERLTEKDRLYITAWYAIANLDYPGAIVTLREMIEKYPLEVEAYQRLGHLLRGEGRYDEAVQILKQGLVVDAEAKDIYNTLGGIYSNLSRHDEAIAMMRRYVELAPDEPNAHDSLALIYQWSGRYREALEEYDRALALHPGFEIAVVNRGNLYLQMGRYADAARQFEQYLRLARSDMEREKGYGSLAWLYLKKGDLAKAEQAAKKELLYGNQTSFGNSLLIALKKGDLEGAGRLREKLSAKSPFTHRGARTPMRYFYYFLGSLELKRGNTAEAVRNFQEALKNLPPLGGTDLLEDCLANGYLESGQFDLAIAEYERILGRNPNYPLARFHLAEAYRLKGSDEKALENYRQFLRIWETADRDLPEVVFAQKYLDNSANS